MCVTVLVCAASALVVAVAVIWVTRSLALRQGLLDVPNERSSHRRPVPRLGGVGIVLGFFAGSGVAVALGTRLDTNALWLALFFGVVAVVGLVDDIKSLPAAMRFPGQLAIATGYCMLAGPIRVADIPGLGPVRLGFLAYPISILWIAWMVNLFNFMDGLDGIAGTQTVVGAAVFAIAAWVAGDAGLVTFAAAVGGASVGFLLFNFPPASIFMGDVGSTALGFCFAAFSLRAASASTIELAAPAAVLATGPFIFDATFTLLRRAAARERFWQAHRSHVYQRPQNWGVAHATVTVVAGAMMLVSALQALLYQFVRSETTRLGIAVLALAMDLLVAGAVLLRDRRHGETLSSARDAA